MKQLSETQLKLISDIEHRVEDKILEPSNATLLIKLISNADNDADMLIRSGIGVAVSNSSQYAKDSADYVIGSHKEDAVAKEIYKIINP